MSQDTRKDKRAKVVSLNVRYKSATVDEFIENHSHDVSKGGIFVKTPTPFPPGTLLKFEIRLAGDKSVISGVGRVVWKREPTQANADKPAGMGVKFIKIDDASRAVIDKLIASKSDAGSAYTSDPAALEDEKSTAQPTTLRGIPSAAPSGPDAAPPGATKTAESPGVAKPGLAPPAQKTPGATASSPNITKTAGATAPKDRPRLDKTIPMGTSPLAQMKNVARPGGAPPAAGSQPSTLTGTGPSASAAGGPPAPMAHKPATAIGVAPPPGALAGSSGAGSSPNIGSPPSRPSEPRSGGATGPGGSGGPGSGGPGSGGPGSGGPPAPRVNQRKATMMGVGLPAPGSIGPENRQPIPREEPATPSKTASGASPMFPKSEPSPMFPKGGEKDYESVKEPTVMKQAAELLEEALREAGGSMEEIGQNPLFSSSSQRDGKLEEQKPAEKTPEPGDAVEQSGDTVILSSPANVPPMKLESTPPTPKVESGAGKPAAAKSTPPATAATPAKPIGPVVAEKKPGGGSGLVIGLVIVMVLAGGGVYAYMSGMISGLGGGGTPTATTPPTTPPPSATQSAVPTPIAVEDASTTSTADAGKVATGDGGATATSTDAGAATSTKDAGGAAALTATPAPKPVPPPFVAPKPKPKPPPPSSAEPPPTATNPDFTPPPPPTPTNAPEL